MHLFVLAAIIILISSSCTPGINSLPPTDVCLISGNCCDKCIGCDCSFNTTGSLGAGKFDDASREDCFCIVCPPGLGSDGSLCGQLSPNPRHYYNASKHLVNVTDTQRCTFWGDEIPNFRDAYEEFASSSSRMLQNEGGFLTIRNANDVLSETIISLQSKAGQFLHMRTGEAACGKLFPPIVIIGPVVSINPITTLKVSYGLKTSFIVLITNDGDLPVIVEFGNFSSPLPIFSIQRAVNGSVIQSNRLLVPGRKRIFYETEPVPEDSQQNAIQVEIDSSGIPVSSVVNDQFSFAFDIIEKQFWDQGNLASSIITRRLNVVLDFSVKIVAVPNEIEVSIPALSAPFSRRISLFNLDQTSNFSFFKSIEFPFNSPSGWLTFIQATNFFLPTIIEPICPDTQLVTEFSNGFEVLINSTALAVGKYTAKVRIDENLAIPVTLAVVPGPFSAANSTYSFTTQNGNLRVGQTLIEFFPRDARGDITSLSVGKFGVNARYLSGQTNCSEILEGGCDLSVSTIGSDFRLQISIKAQGVYEFRFRYFDIRNDEFSIKDDVVNITVLPRDCVADDENSEPIQPFGATCGCVSSFGLLNGKCVQCNVNEFSQDSVCVACEATKRTRNAGATVCTCRPEYYSDNNGTVCVPCPVGAFCADRTLETLLPLQGFFKIPWALGSFVKCRDSDSCIGLVIPQQSLLYDDNFISLALQDYSSRLSKRLAAASIQNRAECEQVCEEKYAGPLCSNCAFGYNKVGGDKCQECFDKQLMIFMIIIGILIALGLTILTIRQSLKNEQTIGEVRVIKILASNLQIVSMSVDFALSYPAFLVTMYEVFGAISSVGQSLWSLECLVDSVSANPCFFQDFEPKFISSGVFDESRPPTFFYEGLALALIPVIWFFITLVFWSVRYFVLRKRGEKRGRSTVAYFTVSNIIVLFFLYPTLARTSFRFFSCSREVVALSETFSFRFFDADFNYVCYGAGHSVWAFTLGLIMIIVYTLGIPIVSFLILYHIRYSQTKYAEAFMFIWAGYKQECYFWEVVILFKKVLLAFVAVIIAPYGADLQAYIGLLILGAGILLQLKFEPFEDPRFNRAELLGTFSAFCTIYLGMYLELPIVKQNIPARNTLGIFILLCNILFLLYCAVLMYQVSSKNPKELFKTLLFNTSHRQNPKQQQQLSQKSQDESSSNPILTTTNLQQANPNHQVLPNL